MTERGLAALDERLAHVADAVGSLVRIDNVVVDDRVNVNGDVVL